MVITEKLLVEWNGSQKSYSEEKGYRFTKFGDKFEVRFEDIPHSSDKFIDVQCDYCGKIFSMQVKKYYRGTTIVSKVACRDCAPIKGVEVKKIRYGTASPNIHGKVKEKWEARNIPKKVKTLNKMISTFKDNDCIMMPSIYVNNETKMPYICNKHIDKGIQWNNWIHLKSGRGCYYCGRESMVEKQKYSIEEVRATIEANGKNKLLSNYTSYNDYNLLISCEVCGQPYTTSYGLFLKGKTKCNECTCSIGEKTILAYLKEHNYVYEHDTHEIYTAYWDNPLRFDFYLPELNMAIEFDGEQHYMPIDFNGDGIEIASINFTENKERDQAKNLHCIDYNIPLMRIPYWERDNINSILDNYFFNNDKTYIINPESLNKDSLLLCS